MQYDIEILSFFSSDGLKLEGTVIKTRKTEVGMVVLVHGGGVDRDEDGFYITLAERLEEAGFSSFRFDWRAHGKSEGELEDMTLLSIVNDIRSAVNTALEQTKLGQVHLVGTSFGGGLSAYYTAKFPKMVKSLVLMNPLLNYKKRLLEEKSFWGQNSLTREGAQELSQQGYLPHGTVFRMGIPLINELFYIHPYLEMKNITVPTLTIHGSNDSMVPFDISEQYHKVRGHSEFIAIEGADHGFTESGDEDYTRPQTIEWQNFAIKKAVSWISKYS